MSELGIPAKMARIHDALAKTDIPHAFGGALALAWCVGEVRATMDIDLNLFVEVAQVDTTLAALPRAITWTDDDEAALRADGQARLFWGRHPVDVFFNTTDFHERAARRVRWELLLDQELPFLACSDLAVFKAFFSRSRDWVDLEEMLRAGSVDVAAVLGVLADYLGPDDERVGRFHALARSIQGDDVGSSG